MSERMYPGMSPDERTTFSPYSAFDIPADLRQLHGRYDVASVARRVRNFRYAEEWMMMIMGGWVATIPEVPVKTGLGKVIWEGAQAADEAPATVFGTASSGTVKVHMHGGLPAGAGPGLAPPRPWVAPATGAAPVAAARRAGSW